MLPFQGPTLSLLFLFATLTAAHPQEHGSPNPPPPSPTIFDPAPFVQPIFNSAAISWAPWVDPAQPTPPPPPPVAEPNSSPGDIYICTAPDFLDTTCTYVHSVTYQCHNLADFGPGLRKNLTSIRPDKGQLCLFYEDDGCVGRADWLRWPGSANMRGRRFDKMVASWRCSDDDCAGAQDVGGCHENADGSPKGG